MFYYYLATSELLRRVSGVLPTFSLRCAVLIHPSRYFPFFCWRVRRIHTNQTAEIEYEFPRTRLGSLMIIASSPVVHGRNKRCQKIYKSAIPPISIHIQYLYQDDVTILNKQKK